MAGTLTQAWLRSAVFLATLLPASAWAHAFNRRYDLPAPLSYFVAGAAAAVALSFFVAALFARKAPGAERDRDGVSVNAPWLPALRIVLRIVGLALFLLVLAAGFFGEADPMTNIVPTLVWIVWWVGMPLTIVCFGNFWPALDPWRTLFDGAEGVIKRLQGRGMTACRAYPRTLAAWPAVLLLLSIGWLELVYSRAATPSHIAWIAVGWTAVTLLGMTFFGRETWQRSADVFAVYFATLGRFAPLAAGANPNRVALRSPGRGLITDNAGSAAMTAFIIAMLSMVLFDGLLNGQAWRGLMRWVGEEAPWLLDGDRYITGTMGLAGLWLLFLAAYYLSCWIASRTAGENSTGAIANRFAPTLVPIAAAYVIAHYFSYLVTQGQAIVALLSDPLGRGWNLFGTAKFEPVIGIFDAKSIWYVAIVAIVSGHVISIWLAHRVALREFGSPRRAVAASIPLTTLMVVFTIISLSVIADPMVRFMPVSRDGGAAIPIIRPGPNHDAPSAWRKHNEDIATATGRRLSA